MTKCSVMYVKRKYSQTLHKGHSREPKKVPFMSSCPLYVGYNYIDCLLMGEIRLLFIDSDWLYRGVL